MKFEPLMTYQANLGAGIEVGAGAYGNRLIVEVHGGAFEGPKLKGKFRDAAAADWAVVSSDGYIHLDVRATLETDDGAYIYLQYNGKLELTEAAGAALAGDRRDQLRRSLFLHHSALPDRRRALRLAQQHRVRERGPAGKPNLVEYNVYQVVND